MEGRQHLIYFLQFYVLIFFHFYFKEKQLKHILIDK